MCARGRRSVSYKLPEERRGPQQLLPRPAAAVQPGPVDQQLPGRRRLPRAGHPGQHHHLRPAARSHPPVHTVCNRERVRRGVHRKPVPEALASGRRQRVSGRGAAADGDQHIAEVGVRQAGAVAELEVVQGRIADVLRVEVLKVVHLHRAQRLPPRGVGLPPHGHEQWQKTQA